MVRYSDELVDEIRNSNDIVDVISQYVVLKRSGRNFFGLCPFHREKSPSFSVSPDKQIFHCFGCGAGGNVIHFVSKIEGLDFKETLEVLAERAGIVLPTLEGGQDNKTLELKQKVYEINQLTAEFYHQNLYKPSAKLAQEYIKKRKLDNNTLKTFSIGYAANFDELYRYLKEKGFPDEEILASCLVSKSENGQFIDRFRKRLMFPIQDTRNRFIAFGGRVLDDSKPKYINSSETIVYSKGKHLFGLNVAKKNPLKKIIIVEGYMDAISLYQRGITNAVASLGTALTEGQGRLLRKSSEQVVIGYDSDGAGQTATLRGLEILQNLGCDIRVLQMKGAKDPDEFVTTYGSERFNKLVEQSISLVEFKVKVLKGSLDLTVTGDKIIFLNKIAKILSDVDNVMEREVYIDKISSEYSISKEAIFAEINKLLYNNKPTKEMAKIKVEPIQAVAKQTTKIDQATLRREKMVIALLLDSGIATYQKMQTEIVPNDFKDENNKKIITKLYEEFEKGNSNISNILNSFENETIISYITEILADDFGITDTNKAIEDMLNIYYIEKLTMQKKELLELYKNPNVTKEEKANIEMQLNDVLAKMKLAKNK